MEEVIVTEASPSTSFSSEARLICRVCEKQFSQYTCPRCNTRYCSLQCYKRHSLRCTESFMRENVMGELQQIQPEDETKKKMLEIIKRFHSEEEEMDSDGEDDSMLSEELIHKVLSGNEIKLEDLSPKEVKLFRRAVASGELSKMIEPWNPWWRQPSAKTISLSPDGTQLIKPLQQQEESSTVNEIPAGAETPIPPLSHLGSSNPSPLLAVHLADVIYSYCFTLRLYNGDWHSDPLSAATEILNISSVLGDDARPESLSERLIKAGERMLKSERMGKARKKGESGRKLKSAERKVYFLTCWVHEQPSEAWSSLASILEVEKASVLAVGHGSKKPGTGESSGVTQTKVLIEEI